jgi:tRNA pseudouridine13 synthase
VGGPPPQQAEDGASSRQSAGNRFTIRVRDVDNEAEAKAGAVLDELGRRGVPNYFGEQRFGVRRNTHRLGRALLRGDANALAHEYLGGPQPGDPPLAQAARRAFDAGDYQAALAKWPSSQREERRVLAAAVRHGGDVQRGLRLLDKKLRRLFVSAYQSYLFNRLLAARIQALDRLELGDVAFIHASGAAFLVKDPAIEQPLTASRSAHQALFMGPKYCWPRVDLASRNKTCWQNQVSR